MYLLSTCMLSLEKCLFRSFVHFKIELLDFLLLNCIPYTFWMLTPYQICSLNFLLRYNCFTILCLFLLYNKMNQLYVYKYPLVPGSPSYPIAHTTHLGHHRALSRVSCATQHITTTVCFNYYMPIPVFPSSPSPPTCVHMSVLYVCTSVPALQINLSVPFFRLHIYVLIYDICFSPSDLLHSVSQSLDSSTLYKRPNFIPFNGWVISHCVYIPHLYTFIYQWTFRLLPCPGYCK